MNDVTYDNMLSDIFSLFDILMGLIVFIFILFFILIIKNKIIEKSSQKLFFIAFLVKCFGAISFVFITKKLGASDTLLYFGSILEITNTDLFTFFDFFFNIDPENYKNDTLLIFTENRGSYMVSPANAMVVKIGTIFVNFAFRSYLGLTFFYTVFSFFGIWCFYLAFKKLYPNIINQIAFSILFLPSALFWGSGILKDTITIGCLGFSIYSSFEILIHKNYQKRLFILFITSSLLLLVIKNYIFFTFIISIFFYIISQNSFFKKYKYFFFILIIALFSYNSQVLISLLIEEARSQAEVYEFIEAGSNVALFEYDFSILGILNMIFTSITAVFFRPFIWESRSFLMLISSLESTIFIIITMYTIFKVGPYNFIKIINANPILLFCTLFSLLFGIIVGFSTFNFGTMARYKIPCLPFYLINLFIILSISKNKKLRNAIN